MSDEPRVISSYPLCTVRDEGEGGSKLQTVNHICLVWSNGRVERVHIDHEQFDVGSQLIRPGRGSG
jgi:hypothetical protein